MFTQTPTHSYTHKDPRDGEREGEKINFPNVGGKEEEEERGRGRKWG